MSKYLSDQAHEREQRRERLRGLRGLPITDTPAAPATPSRPIETSAGLDALLQQIAATMAPKGVEQTPGQGLKVAPGSVSRSSGDGGGAYNAGDGGGGGGGLGGLLDNLLKAKGEKGEKGASVRDRSTSGAAERAQRLRDTMPGPYAKGAAATSYVQDKIPGLKPGIPTPPPTSEGKPAAPPSEPAARAYLEQQRADIPPITMTDKANLPAGYEEDLKFLEERGGHHTKVIDGKNTNVPLSEKGGYKDLDPELAGRLRAAAEAYEKDTGKKAKFGEFSRGEDVQKIYWEDSAHGTKYAAAPPGRSHHQGGGAGDLPDSGFRQWLKEGNQDKFGVHFPVKGDEPHVEINKAYKGESFVKPATPSATANLPPWDQGLPVADAKTNWPDPSAATPAAQIKGTPVDTSTGFSSGGEVTAGSGSISPKLMEHTKFWEGYSAKAYPDGAQYSIGYGSKAKSPNEVIDEPTARARVTEELKQAQTEVNKILPANAPQGVRDSLTSFTHNLGPGWMQKDSKLADAVRRGDWEGASKEMRGYNHAGGQVVEGLTKRREGDIGLMKGDQTAVTKLAAAATPDPNAPSPAATPADVGKPEAMLRDVAVPSKAGTVEVGGVQNPPAVSATPSADVFEKGTTAVPVSGAGGLQEGADPPETTGATLYPDKDTAALNAIKPAAPAVAPAPPAAAAPTAAAPPAPAPVTTAPPAATPPVAAPPPTRQAPPPPARQAAPAAAPPLTPAQVAAAQPKPAANPAHRFLDMNTVDFAEHIKKGAGSQVPGMVSGMTVREVVNHPIFGGMAKAQLGEGLKAVGVTQKQFEDAMKEGKPPPGKQSAVQGTSDATDFSARSRTPLAPPGLDKVDAKGVVSDIRQKFGPAMTAEEFKAQKYEGVFPQKGDKSNMPDSNRYEYGGRDVPERMPAIDPTKTPDIPRVPFGTPDFPLRELNSGQSSVRYGPPGVRGEGQQRLGERLGMERKPNFDVGSQPLVRNADGSISTVRTIGIEENGKQVNIPTVPAEGGRIMTNEEAIQRYKETGRHLGKFDTIEQASAAAEALHQEEAKRISQPQSQAAPQITPEMAKAIENAVKLDNVPLPAIPPDAQPVLPSSQPGGPGAGLSLAPPGLQNLATGPTAPGAGPMQSAFMPGSQGGAIATAGIMPQTGVFSTPLLDAAAQQQPAGGFGASSFSPIAPQFMSWGSGLGGSSGASGFGGLYGGTDVGADTSIGSMNFTPMTWGG